MDMFHPDDVETSVEAEVSILINKYFLLSCQNDVKLCFVQVLQLWRASCCIGVA